MKKQYIVFIIISSLLLSSCATILGGKLTPCQTQRMPNHPPREIRPIPLIFDFILGGVFAVGIDFLTGAIYKPCYDSIPYSNQPKMVHIVNQNNPIRNVVAINPSALFYPKFVEARYERVLNSFVSFVVHPQLWTLQDVPSKYNNKQYTTNMTFTSLNLQSRFYLLSYYNAPEGLYLAPLAGIGNLNIGGSYAELNTLEQNSKLKYTNSFYFTTGIVLGYQWCIKKTFLFDLNFGARRVYSFSNLHDHLIKESDEGPILPALSFTIGYKL